MSINSDVFGDIYTELYEILYSDKDYQKEVQYVANILESFGYKNCNLLINPHLLRAVTF